MKWFALLGLLLFLGVAVAPSITSFQQNLNDFTLDDNENRNCIIIGRTDVTIFGGYLKLPLGRSIGLGVYEPLFDETVYAKGWIITLGINGFRKWEGALKGNLSISTRLILRHPNIGTGLYEIYNGVDGFKGIKVGRSNPCFIGIARQVKLDVIS